MSQKYHENVTRLPLECHKNVTKCHKNDTKMPQVYHKYVTECHEKVTQMSQKHPENATRMPQECHKNATRMSYECHNNVTRMSYITKISRECLRNVMLMSQECHKNDTRMSLKRPFVMTLSINVSKASICDIKCHNIAYVVVTWIKAQILSCFDIETSRTESHVAQSKMKKDPNKLVHLDSTAW
jgi:hypothetical protein